ncbi:thiamine phosphate synthase [Arsukibacterium indicum]|uniref:Thiamine-phosphate synthase n=1 Tax=Arsukibacterium indicum TaxID=2848612 RepID=A0ABS6MMD0_9GAMM|nr:thiamine phosphate synthase [Arsukibacterium indicum]MBV2129965.1 thiamine phosphate synthase [Arsukibacterium indicum]
MPEQHIASKPIVWTIASSDSGGGAGIQADLLTFTALGCHGCSAVAGVSAQNSMTFNVIEAVSPAMLQSQLDCLLSDMPPAAIKIGLIPDEQLLLLLRQWLEKNKPRHSFRVIADPVLSTSSGHNFASGRLISRWRNLLPLLDLITPNLPELALLSGMPDAAISAQVTQLVQHAKTAVLVKGGHSTSDDVVTDQLFEKDSYFELKHQRITTPHTHGTGCVLSAAIAAGCAQDYPLHDAVIIATAYLQQALEHGYPTGNGAGCMQHHGWPSEYRYFPQLHWPADYRAQQGCMQQFSFASMAVPIGLYPVIDSVQWLKRLLPLEPDVIQLRIKDGSEREVAQQIVQAVQLSRDYKLRLFINDHWKLAIKYGAYGVHLGQQDLATADLKAIADAGLHLGISTHNYLELLRARQLKPSYVALGHIFATQTKQMQSKPQGVKRLKYYAAICQDIPTVAIGGIDAQKLAAVVGSGVDGVAVVSAITEHSDPERAFMQLRQQFRQYKLEAHYAYST